MDLWGLLHRSVRLDPMAPSLPADPEDHSDLTVPWLLLVRSGRRDPKDQLRLLDLMDHLVHSALLLLSDL